jgi:hypothetical protein
MRHFTAPVKPITFCSMVIAGYVSVCVQLYCILVFTVFPYMFRPTWPSSCVQDSSYIYFHMLKGFCFPAFFGSLPFFFFFFHADRNIICNNHWTIQCSMMLKYSTITFWLVAYCLNQLHYHKPPAKQKSSKIKFRLQSATYQNMVHTQHFNYIF